MTTDFWTIVGRTPEEWADPHRMSPYRALQALDVGSQLHFLQKGSQVPWLHESVLDGAAQYCLEEIKPKAGGFGGCGILLRGSGWKENDPDLTREIFIHWPTALRTLLKRAGDSEHHAFVVYMLSMYPVFKSQSYVLAEFIRRHCLDEHTKRIDAARGDGGEGVFWDSADRMRKAERKVMRLLLNARLTATKNPLVEGIHAALMNTYTKEFLIPQREMRRIFADRGIGMESPIKGVDTVFDPKDFSFFDMRKFRKMERKTFLQRVTPVVDLQRQQLPPEYDGMLYELLFARDVGAIEKEEELQRLYGVRHYSWKEDGETRVVRAIDCRRFVATRLAQRKALNPNDNVYRQLLPVGEVYQADTHRFPDFYAHAATTIRRKYRAAQSLQVEFRRRFVKKEPGPFEYSAANDENYLVILDVREMMNSLPNYFANHVNGPRTRKDAGAALANVPFRSITQEVHMGDNVMMPVKIAHRRGKVLLTVPWAVEDGARRRAYRRRPRTLPKTGEPVRLAEGVVYDVHGKEYFYTTDFIKQSARLDARKHSQYWALVQEMTRLQRDRFDELYAKKLSKGRSTYYYTPAEDAVIIEYLRPNMSLADKAAIEAVCNRGWKKIRARARVLRRKMITKGVYDVDKLPHSQFNHRIGLEITAAMEAKESEDV